MSLVKKLCLSLASLLGVLGFLTGAVWLSIAEEQIEFRNGDLLLRGTLLLPRRIDPTPGVVLVHGSGEVTRKSMMAYAWLFALKGYAALAYDKRGLGASEGLPHEWREFSFEHLAADAAAAYRLLQTRREIDARRVGFFAASQGGWVVSLAADQVEAPDFIVMASVSVSTVAEDRLFGREAQVRHAGFEEAAAGEALRLLRADHGVTRTNSGYREFIEIWNEYDDRAWFEEVYAGADPEPLNSDHRQWERTILDFDPQPLLNLIGAPVLWVFADPRLDRFSPVALSMSRVSAAQSAGACYQLIQVDGVGHTLEPEDSGGLFARLKVRVPLVLGIYSWLDDLDLPDACGAGAHVNRP